MIVRIVRMAFAPSEVETFEGIFARSKAAIRAFPGCRHLQLHRDAEAPNVRYTLSHWDSPEALAAYRQSELFRSTWAATKVLFSDKPQAFSLALLQDLP